MHKVITLPSNSWPQTSSQILETAAGIVAERFVRGGAFCNRKQPWIFCALSSTSINVKCLR